MDRTLVETIGYPAKESIQRLGNRLECSYGRLGSGIVLLPCPMVLHYCGRDVLLSTDGIAVDGL